MLENNPQKRRYEFSPELVAQLESQMAQGRVTSSDATKRVVRPIVPTRIKYKLKPGETFITNRDGSKTLVRSKNEEVQQDNRSKQQRQQDAKSTQYKRQKIQKDKAIEQTVTALSNAIRQVMPSSIARAVYDATTGDKSFIGSMVEGNEGLGDEALNLAFDIAAPMGIARGFRYASEAIPKFARFGVSNHTGNWTRFGNNQPIRGNYYDGYIGRDHAFGLGEYNGIVKDEMWPFGSFPETYVIKNADQAALLEGNNGAFNGPAYSRRQGGKMLKTK